MAGGSRENKLKGVLAAVIGEEGKNFPKGGGASLAAAFSREKEKFSLLGFSLSF